MPQTIIKNTQEKMEKSLVALREQLAKIHTGRANPGLLSDVMVDYYGSKVPIKQIANLSVPETRQLLVQPWDKEAVFPIEKAVQAANLGLKPQVEGGVVRIMVPELTEDRRKELKKVIDDFGEKCRVQIRAHRQDGIKEIRDLEQGKMISEDESHRYQEQIQGITDGFNKKIEEVHEAKAKEILTV